jgi:predicted phosphohydrolase
MEGFHGYNPNMRILVTADLHYDIRRSRQPTKDVACRAVRTGGDALVLVGDTAGRDLNTMRECLDLFDGFPGRKLLVPGNHCLWGWAGEDSLDRYHNTLPALAEEAGFSVLDHQPEVMGSIGLAGSIGWYDYSFRDDNLGIPEAFYEAKVSPGAAARFEEHEALLEAHADVLTERQMAFGARWMDCEYVTLGMSDREFVARLAERLDEQLTTLSESCRQIITFIHHLPFAISVPEGRPDRFAFAAAYLGAERFGQTLLGHAKVSHVYCGHSHWRDVRRVGHMDVINIGSTYVEKHLEILDLPE